MLLCRTLVQRTNLLFFLFLYLFLWHCLNLATSLQHYVTAYHEQERVYDLQRQMSDTLLVTSMEKDGRVSLPGQNRRKYGGKYITHQEEDTGDTLPLGSVSTTVSTTVFSPSKLKMLNYRRLQRQCKKSQCYQIFLERRKPATNGPTLEMFLLVSEEKLWWLLRNGLWQPYGLSWAHRYVLGWSKRWRIVLWLVAKSCRHQVS